MVQNLLRRYIWLIDTLLPEGQTGLTLSQISDRWDRSPLSDGGGYPERTFHNHRKNIYEIFNINIKCRKSGNVYYIDSSSDVRDIDGYRRWLLDAISLSNSIDENVNIRDRILLEPVPSGRENLSDILRAMQNNNKIMFTYRSFWKPADAPASQIYDFEPYAVKMFHRRWYVLGRFGESPLRVFALDSRMSDVDFSDETFQLPDDFDAETMFRNCYGIILPEEGSDVQMVRLRVNADQSHYIRSLPLHHSQREQCQNDDGSVVFEYCLYDTLDFRQAILEQGDAVEVLSPLSLRNAIAEMASSMQKIYSDCE